MKATDLIKLTEAYNKICEDVQDAAQDAALKKVLSYIILAAVADGYLSEGLAERNVGAVVDKMFEHIQKHVRASEAQAYEDGMQATRDMDEFYADKSNR